MIKKLRIQLILAAMASLFAVLTVIIGAVHVVGYRKVLSDADAVLAVLTENGGHFPRPGRPGKAPPRFASPEIPYESRYFSVLLSADGTAAAVDTGKIAAVSTETAMEYARTVREKGRERGFIGDYRYTVQEADGGLRVIFLDCGRTLSSFRANLWTSLLVSFLGFLAVLVLMILLSSRAVRPVAESYAKQKRFITDAGHELKTPLTVIGADAELLGMDLGENEWLEDIRRQVERLTELTRDLIDLSRMDEEQPPLQRLDFPLSDMASETAQSFSALARTQNKAFTAEVQENLSLCGDEKRLRQMLTILLDNALKYSPAGGEIAMTLERRGRFVRLRVQNTTDMPLPEDLSRLFERFYRADASRSTRGYGIGLSIAKAIVQAHGGRISACAAHGGRISACAAHSGRISACAAHGGRISAAEKNVLSVEVLLPG